MRSKFWVFLNVLILHTSISAQQNFPSKDSIITFKVFGNCEMCKNRIEKAAKAKGVKSATWDVDTKLLSLDYDPLITSPKKVQQRIADVGHDTELQKAKGLVYNELPDCCHYRERDEMSSGIHSDQTEGIPSSKKGVQEFILTRSQIMLRRMALLQVWLWKWTIKEIFIQCKAPV